MQQKISVKVQPSVAADENSLKNRLAQEAGVPVDQITGYQLLKKSLDARGRQPHFQITAQVFIDEPPVAGNIHFHFPDVQHAKNQVIVVGAGPAGLFAALQLIRQGIKPIVLERGKDVRARRRDLAALNKEGIVNPESNYCFGEGGAGTYSDGKLYTRSTKRGNVQEVLELLVHFGATEKILYESHPHIGTNKLPQIITAMRDGIRASGGEVHFEKKLVHFSLDGDHITTVKTADGDEFPCSAMILATGHSARDIFELLYRKNLQIFFKPFALGVRVEHPQSLIDSAQYHCALRSEHLPAAAYSLVQQVDGQGVFSFCMCPGGIIAPAATAPGEVVVNGWSPSKRDNPFANSGIVVTVSEEQVIQSGLSKAQKATPLKGVNFQQMVEQKAFVAGGSTLQAPAQRMEDFYRNKISSTLPDCSYLPGLHSADLRTVLPPFVHKSLQQGFAAFGKKLKGYFTNDAVIVATESRTSSPVRIPRLDEALHHPQVKNLFPCAEGAGYAGGIVSAAMDGQRVASVVAASVLGK